MYATRIHNIGIRRALSQDIVWKLTISSVTSWAAGQVRESAMRPIYETVEDTGFQAILASIWSINELKASQT